MALIVGAIALAVVVLPSVIGDGEHGLFVYIAQLIGLFVAAMTLARFGFDGVRDDPAQAPFRAGAVVFGIMAAAMAANLALMFFVRDGLAGLGLLGHSVGDALNTFQTGHGLQTLLAGVTPFILVGLGVAAFAAGVAMAQPKTTDADSAPSSRASINPMFAGLAALCFLAQPLGGAIATNLAGSGGSELYAVKRDVDRLRGSAQKHLSLLLMERALGAPMPPDGATNPRITGAVRNAIGAACNEAQVSGARCSPTAVVGAVIAMDNRFERDSKLLRDLNLEAALVGTQAKPLTPASAASPDTGGQAANARPAEPYEALAAYRDLNRDAIRRAANAFDGRGSSFSAFSTVDEDAASMAQVAAQAVIDRALDGPPPLGLRQDQVPNVSSGRHFAQKLATVVVAPSVGRQAKAWTGKAVRTLVATCQTAPCSGEALRAEGAALASAAHPTPPVAALADWADDVRRHFRAQRATFARVNAVAEDARDQLNPSLDQPRNRRRPPPYGPGISCVCKEWRGDRIFFTAVCETKAQADAFETRCTSRNNR